MQTHLSAEFAASTQGREAAAIVRKCVHCGFCNATCPTYQLLGDELDGPRGRIYLIKQMLEGAEVTRSTQQHLDRCLTCLNCQTTCPSGVEYGHLVDIGRKLVEERVERPPRRKSGSLVASRRTDLVLVRPGAAAGPSAAAAVAQSTKEQGAGAGERAACGCRPRHAAAQSVGAAGLRAACDVAQHRSGDRARARCGGHPSRVRRRQRLLRRAAHALERQPGRPCRTCGAISMLGRRSWRQEK